MKTLGMVTGHEQFIFMYKQFLSQALVSCGVNKSPRICEVNLAS